MDQLRMAILKITFSKVRQLHLNWLMSLKTFKNEIINEFFQQNTILIKHRNRNNPRRKSYSPLLLRNQENKRNYQQMNSRQLENDDRSLLSDEVRMLREITAPTQANLTIS